MLATPRPGYRQSQGSCCASKGRLTSREASPPEPPRPASWDRFVWIPIGRRISLDPCRERKRVLPPPSPLPQDKRQECFCRNRLFAKQMQWCASIKLYFYE